MSKPNVPNATTPTASHFFISPPERDSFAVSFFIHCDRRVSRLWFEDKNSGPFVLMSRRSDVVAIHLRGPKRGTGTSLRGYFPDGFVMIGIFLLVGKAISDVK